MKAQLVAAVLVLLCIAKPCFAHRLDEYLQSAKVTVEQHEIDVDLRLTPGEAVLREIAPLIDLNEDNVVSDEEGLAYAERVRGDLSLTVDDQPVPMRLTSSTFPDVDQLKAGLGEIDLHFQASTPLVAGSGHVVFENHHMTRLSVHLANCFVPRDPNIHITTQSRSYDQSTFTIGYARTDAATTRPATMASGSGPEEMTSFSLFGGYVRHGIGHILTGYDHLLFLSALVLGAGGLWDAIKVVSAFTVAHTLTLTLAAVGLIHVSAQIVEPLIAASIVFVALQNVFWHRGSHGANRVAAAFLFGLFHGLGFAGGLLEVMREMPGASMFLAIISFAIGVEAGHQLVTIPLFVCLKAAGGGERAEGEKSTRRSIALRGILSASIATAGVYYLCLSLIASSY